MKTDEEIRRTIPARIRILQETVALGRNHFREVNADTDTDNLAFMALCFVSKQIEHAASTILLVEAGQDRDAGVIARLMLEGMAILLWAAREPEIRPKLWRDFAYIEDFRTLSQLEAAGTPVEPYDRERIMEGIKTHGEPFLKAGGKRAIANGSPLSPDSFRVFWNDLSPERVFDEIESKELHTVIYSEVSQWVHWTTKGIARAIRRVDGGVAFEARSPQMAATAIASGFQGLQLTLKLADRHLHLGIGGDLTRLAERLLSEVV